MSQPPQRPVNPDNLLKWSIAASGDQEAGQGEGATAGNAIQNIAQDIQHGRRPDLADPALYDAVMGKSEAQMMREELQAALDINRSEEDRIQALDNFEMLIEHIDNANNMTSMKMWKPLVDLLEGEPGSDVAGASTTVSPAIQLATLWILGTAVQNNDKAQMAILNFDPLRPILQLLVHSHDAQVRSKAMYALSGILKHNAKAVDVFSRQNGWIALRGALLDPDVSLRRKAAFLVNTLLLQDDSASEDLVNTTIAAAGTGQATAVAPLSRASDANGTTDLPVAPLEQPPATQLSGVAHPAVAPELIKSKLLPTLVVSLLAFDVQEKLPEDALQGINASATSAGPDGDVELRDDLDYSEKAARACLTFTQKVTDTRRAPQIREMLSDSRTLHQIKALLQALHMELESPSLESSDSGVAGDAKRWQELGLSSEEVQTFLQQVQAM